MALLRLERRPESVDDPVTPPATALVAVGRPRSVQHASSPDDRLAALGLRSLADLLAPSSLVIGDDHLVLDGEYTRVLVVADLPPVVAAGWLNGMLAERLPVNLSLHLRPLEPGPAAKALKLKSWRLGGALSDDAANGRPIDNNLTTALEQVSVEGANGDSRGFNERNHEGVVDDDIYFARFHDMTYFPVRDDPLSSTLPPVPQTR